MTKMFQKDFFSLVRMIIVIFLCGYLLTASAALEDDIIMTSTIWKKRAAASNVFDVRQSFSILFQNILAPGIRNVMADLIMIKVHDLWHEKRWYRMPEYLDMVTILEPEWIEGWELGAWHMAYNVTYQIKDSPFISEKDKEKEINWWLDRAVRMLKSGIIINSDTFRLYFYLSWIYFHRIHDYDNAIKYANQAKMLPDHISFVERLVAYSYEKKGNVKKALEILKELRKDENYHHNDQYIINVLDKNIKRLENKEKKP